MSKYKERRQIKHTHIHPRNCYIQINIIFRNDLETFISGITLEIITLCQNFHYVKSLTLVSSILPFRSKIIVLSNTKKAEGYSYELVNCFGKASIR